MTWWIAGVREALFPGGPGSVGGDGSLYASVFGHANPGSAEIIGALLASGVVVTLAAVAVFRRSDRRARQAGLYDQTSGS